jgi:cytochrome c oxidase cbb3-type subunit 1
MSDSSLTSNSSVPVPSQSEIDASCRVPLLALFSGAALWLLVAAVATLLASMSFHKPDMFADKMWLSYGRILPFAKTAFLYGFCLPAGYGLALWLAARLGRTKLTCGIASTFGAKLWNLGVLIGAFGILCGASTGYEGFEIPRYAASILFAASLIFGFVGLTTIHNRTEKELYPSLWFIIAGLFWFPWILSTALFTLGAFPVRGIAQIAVQSWYLNNLQLVSFGLFGLGAAFYFMPKLAGKNLHSKYLALFAFFTLILFGSWAGVLPGTPLPAWMSTLSTIAAVFLVLTLIAVFEIVRHICCWSAPDAEAKFFSVSIFYFMFALVAGLVAVLPGISTRLGLTLYHAGQTELLVAGFFGMVALGGIYHVLPKVADVKWPFAGFVRAHLWLATFGVLLISVAYLLGGVQQGAKLNHAGIDFAEVAKSTLMPIRMASLGELLWLLGSLLFAGNVFALVYQRARACIKPFVGEVTTIIPASEVKA